MDQIQTKAIKTYQDNLAYLQQVHPKLYDKIVLLDTVINDGTYTEQYSLEYKTEGYFDVLELSSGHYLYNNDSIKYAKRLVDSLDFSRINGVFEAQRYVDFSPEMPDIIDKSPLHFHNALWASIKIIEYAKQVSPRISHMKQVYKMMFLGTGLGIHIPLAVQKLNAKIIFIQEHNLELFRLSLFVTQYFKLAKKVELFFSVMENGINERMNFIYFLERGNNYNLYLKQVSFTAENEAELFRYQDYVMTQDHIVYPYSAYLLRYIDSPRYMVDGYSIVNISKRYQNDIWEKPVLFVFSGPSSANNIDWLKLNKDNFILVSPLSACRFLYKHGIKPDVVVHADPEEHAGLLTLEGIEESFFENVICIFSSNVHPSVVYRFKKDQVFCINQEAEYKAGFGSFSSATVGEYTYGIFLILGAKEIYILGIDLALDANTLTSHVPEHPFAEQHSLTESTQQLEKSIVYIPGNFQPEVPSNPMYKMAVEQFGRLSELFKTDEQHVYNLSNGARLEGATPLNLDSGVLNINQKLDKDEIHYRLEHFFKAISSNEYRAEDRNILIHQLELAKKLWERIQQFKKQKFMLPLLYIDAIGNLNRDLSDLENKTKSDLSMVYYLYFKVVFSYISEVFNTSGLEHPHKHIEEINTILIKQLEKLAKAFITAFESYVNTSEKEK